VQRLNHCKGLSIGAFLENYDFYLPFKKTPGSDFVVASLLKLTKTFTEESSESSVFASELDSDDAASYAADTLIEMIHRHGWDEMKPVAQLCFSRLRKLSHKRPENQRGQRKRPENLVSRLTALNKLSSIHDLVGLRREVVEDFVTEIEELRSDASGMSVLSVENVEILVRGLFEHMTDSYCERIESWVARASLEELSKLDTAFKRVAKEGLPRLFNASLVERCTMTIRNRWRDLHLEKLRGLEKALISATQCGEPKFTWYMLAAKTPNQALTGFLRNSRCGPEIIVVGGNVTNARSLATLNSKEKDHIKRGYSAQIFAMSAHGENAAIRVTKTKAYHQALVQRYREAKRALDKVQSTIRELGGTVSESSTTGNESASTKIETVAKKGTTRSASIKTEIAAPAPKRPRTKAPIPKDAEIIDIDI
jgi:hypothetical protein